MFSWYQDGSILLLLVTFYIICSVLSTAERIEIGCKIRGNSCYVPIGNGNNIKYVTKSNKIEPSCEANQMDRTKSTNDEKSVAKTQDVNQEFSYGSYLSWKTEAPYRSICSSRDLENYDMKLANSAIRLMKKMNMKVYWMWNSAGGLLAFNPKDFHVMVTEHYWASCYKNLFKARENFEESWRKKCNTLYVCPNVYDIQDTSQKVLTCLSSSLEYLKELELLLQLHNQRPVNVTPIAVVRSPILGIDKAKPIYWTVSHDVVYFQICNCYMGNIIKEILQRMDNYFLLLRGIDTIDFWTELSENSKDESSENVLNEVERFVSKPKRLKLCKPSLQTISEELPIRLVDSSVSKLFGRLKSHSRCYSDESLENSRIGNFVTPKNFSDASAMLSMELIGDCKYSSDSQKVSSVKKLETLIPKKQKSLSVTSQISSKAKLLKFGRRPIAFILQKIRKNIKSYDSISVAKITSGTKGLI